MGKDASLHRCGEVTFPLRCCGVESPALGASVGSYPFPVDSDCLCGSCWVRPFSPLGPFLWCPAGPLLPQTLSPVSRAHPQIFLLGSSAPCHSLDGLVGDSPSPPSVAPQASIICSAPHFCPRRQTLAVTSVALHLVSAQRMSLLLSSPQSPPL